MLGDDFDLQESRSRREVMPLPEMFWDEPPATNEAVSGFLDHLEKVMAQSGFLNPAQPGQVMTRMRRLFMRARPDKMEMSILRGVLVALEKKMPRDDG